MPVLLLARGDQESRNLLRRAIEARYGLGPPAIESLKLELKGRVRTKIGPVAAWIPLEGIAYFKFPFSVRWNYTTHTAGLVRSDNADGFDGSVCRQRHGSQTRVFADAASVASARAQLWALSGLLLMPLSEPYVELRASGAHSLDAVNHDCTVTAHLQLNEDYSLGFATTECLNPATRRQQTFALRLNEGQKVVGGLMLPGKITLERDNHAEMEVTPVAAEINPPLDEAIFRLEID